MTEHTPEQDAETLVAVDGRDALAYVIVRPCEEPGRVTVEAGAHGMSKAAAAYVLRHVACQFAAEAHTKEQATAERPTGLDAPLDHVAANLPSDERAQQ